MVTYLLKDGAHELTGCSLAVEMAEMTAMLEPEKSSAYPLHMTNLYLNVQIHDVKDLNLNNF